MKKILYLLALAVPALSFAQLTVTTNSVASSLAQSIAGNGVTVSNATLNCGPNGSGDFTYTGTNLGMSSGIILTTGFASDAASAGTYFCSQSTGNSFTDPQLTAIDPSATNDVCMLEFDFVPVCNSISITFVFGSEEYPTFVGSFNDAFGIFLTGPNPGGGSYTSTNIGVLPNNTPVSINNVNAGMNSTYFVDNYTNPNNDVAYDGYTVPVTSVTQVVPCSTYHVKIGIADAIDQAYDSGVFIGSNAVSCTTAPVVTTSATPAACGGSNGSVTASVTNYTGTVTYNWLPGNQNTATVSGLSVGTYSCVVTYTAGCSSAISQTVTASVTNSGSSIVISASTQSATCSNANDGTATANPSGGLAPYTYTWTTNPAQNTQTATGLSAGIYSVTVTDSAGCVQTTTVNVGISNPTVLQFSNVQICGTQATFTAPAGSNYQWYDPSNAVISGATSQTHNASGVSGGQYYTVSYTNNSTGCKDSLRFNVTQTTLNFNPITSSPCGGGSNGSLTFNPGSGNTYTSFDWMLGGTSSNSGTAVPPPVSMSNLAAGTYSVVISVNGNSTCAYTYTTTLVAGQIPPPIIDTIRACNADTVDLNPNVANTTYNWYTGGVFINSSSSASPLTLYPLPHTGLNVNTGGATYYDTIVNSFGCKSVYVAVIKTMSFNSSLSLLQAIKCHDDSIGKLKVTVVRENDGPINQPYQFTWVYPPPQSSPSPLVINQSPPVSNTQVNLHPGTYQVIVSAGNCVDTLTYTLQNPPALLVDTMNAYYCPKDSLALIVAEPGHNPYYWVYNDAVISGYNNDSIYVVLAAIDDYSVYYLEAGCRDSANIRVDHPLLKAFRPDISTNIFTPNGDGINDLFYPFYDPYNTQYQIHKQVEEYELKIYNRWGKKVYETTNYNQPWSGKNPNGDPAGDGTYFWTAKYKSNCSSKADVVEMQGYIQLLR